MRPRPFFCAWSELPPRAPFRRNPTENELDELFAQVGSSAGGSLDKATLLKAAAVMEERMSKVDQEAELLQAFAIFVRLRPVPRPSVVHGVPTPSQRAPVPPRQDKEGNGTISTRRRPASLPRGRDPSGA